MADSPFPRSGLHLPYPFNQEKPFDKSLLKVNRRQCQHDESENIGMACLGVAKRVNENDDKNNSTNYKEFEQKSSEPDRNIFKEDTRQGHRQSVSVEDHIFIQTFEFAATLPKESFRIRKKMLLRQLFSTYFFHGICQVRINNIQSTEIKTEDLEALKEAIGKAREVIYNFESFLLSTHVSNVATENEIKMWTNYFAEENSAVNVCYDKSMFYETLTEDDLNRYMDQQSRLCYALGLRHDFLDELNDFPAEIRFHLTLEDWILTFLQNNLERENVLSMKGSLSARHFVKLGFRAESRATRTMLSRAKPMRDHVELIALARRFIRDELKYNPVLCDNVPRFPFGTSSANVRFKIREPTGKRLIVLNATIVEDVHGATINPTKDFISTHISKLARDEARVVLFHGTDHRSAVDIINRGIDIDLGHPKRDFSDGSGFYLSDNFERSRTWCFSQTRKPAILVFNVEKCCLEEAVGMNLRANQSKTEWSDLVTAFRNGRATKKLRKRLITYDFIEGPVASMSERAQKKVPLAIEESYQLCLTTDNFADEIRGYLHSVIFYDNS